LIWIYHANPRLQLLISSASNEIELIKLVIACLTDYYQATRVKHSELDIAFAATGGPSPWVNARSMHIEFSPHPTRPSQYGDILVEQAFGYVNLSTPAGFIPLVDVVEQQGFLKRKTIN
jgi:hypothetical protein